MKITYNKYKNQMRTELKIFKYINNPKKKYHFLKIIHE